MAQSVVLKVAVIGAGVAGLAAARELKREGHQVVVYEKSGQLGGLWVYDPRVESDPLSLDPNREIVHGSLYRSLCTNLPRQLMGFSDYPFTITRNGESPVFPGHEEVLRFLKEFAQDFGLVQLIRFNTEVVRVERVDPRNDEWVVESRIGGELGLVEEEFDAVVVCNGHYTLPNVAELPGIEKWPGKQVHSHNYRVPDPFRDQVVVVIGDGPSGHDISKEISMLASEVHISSRSPRFEVGELDSHGKMWQHSKIKCVHENGEVEFEDGVFVRADVILHCTGFKYDFPFLRTKGIVTIDDNRVGPLYKHVFPPKLAPGLSFVGIPFRTIIFMMMELQAKWVAHVLSGKSLLPSAEDMLATVEEHYRKMEEAGLPKQQTHSLLFSEIEYLDWLCGEVGLPGVDVQIKELYRKLFKYFVENGWFGFKEWAEDFFKEEV